MYYVLEVGASFEAVNVVTVAIVPVRALLIVTAGNVQAISKQVKRGWRGEKPEGRILQNEYKQKRCKNCNYVTEEYNSV